MFGFGESGRKSSTKGYDNYYDGSYSSPASVATNKEPTQNATQNTATVVTPAPVAVKKIVPKSNNWADIVAAYFPPSEMKAGGLVRGCGCAKRGKTRGKMV